MPPLLLGLDLGSTSLKAVVYDLEGHVVASGSRPTELFHPHADHPEWAVWQPEQIWGGAAAAVREAVAKLDDPRQIAGLAVTGMGMDGLPVDADGRWLYPMISWHDPRTVGQLAWWKEHVGVERTFAIGGNPLWPINSALRIRWIAENEPEIFARTHKWLLIEDFVNWLLCARQATDYSMASCTALFDQRRLDWSDELLTAAEIPRQMLCDVLPSGTPLGQVTAAAARETGLSEGTPVILGGHDHLCGALPVGAFRPGVVLDVTGTWESVLTATAGLAGERKGTGSEPIDDNAAEARCREVPVPFLSQSLRPELREMGMTVQAHVARGMHAVWGGNVAGGMLEWYRKEFAPGADWDELMAAAAASPPGARRAMFLPHLSGATCPLVDEQSRGALVGLSNLTTAGDLLRAVIEGLDYQFRDIVASLERGLDVPFERFIAVGGVTRNAFWMQNKADVVGRPIEVPDVEEASPLGAAMLAGIGLGLYRDEQAAFERVYRPGRTFQPDPALAARYSQWFEIYRGVYPALRNGPAQRLAASTLTSTPK
jgi:xylulokinase